MDKVLSFKRLEVGLFRCLHEALSPLYWRSDISSMYYYTRGLVVYASHQLGWSTKKPVVIEGTALLSSSNFFHVIRIQPSNSPGSISGSH